MTRAETQADQCIHVVAEGEAEDQRLREQAGADEAYERVLDEMRAIENEPMPEYREFVAEMELRREPCSYECGRYICWRKCCFPPESFGEVQNALCHRCRKQNFPRHDEHEHDYVCSICLRRLAASC